MTNEKYMDLILDKKNGLFSYKAYVTNKTEFELPCEKLPDRIIIVGCEGVCKNPQSQGVLYVNNIKDIKTFKNDVRFLTSTLNKKIKPENIN